MGQIHIEMIQEKWHDLAVGQSTTTTMEETSTNSRPPHMGENKPLTCANRKVLSSPGGGREGR
jgi:hypothetical protein